MISLSWFFWSFLHLKHRQHSRDFSKYSSRTSFHVYQSLCLFKSHPSVLSNFPLLWLHIIVTFSSYLSSASCEVPSLIHQVNITLAAWCSFSGITWLCPLPSTYSYDLINHLLSLLTRVDCIKADNILDLLIVEDHYAQCLPCTKHLVNTSWRNEIIIIISIYYIL